MAEFARLTVYPLTLFILYFWSFVVYKPRKAGIATDRSLKSRLFSATVITLILLPLSVFMSFFSNNIKGYPLGLNEITFILLYLSPLTAIVTTAFSRKPLVSIEAANNPSQPKSTRNSNLNRTTGQRVLVYPLGQRLLMVGVAFALFLFGVASLEMRTCGLVDRLFGSSGCAIQIEDDKGVIFQIKYSQDGKLLALGGAALRLYRSSDASLVRTILEETRDISEGVGSIAFSPNGELLAGANFNDKLRIWRVSDGALLQTLTIPKGDTTTRKLQFSPDGTLLVNGISEAGVQIWRVSDWQLVKEIKDHDTFSFTPTGQFVLPQARGKLQFLDTSTWSVVRTLDGVDGYGLVFSPDNKLMATILAGNTGPERTVGVYRVEDGKLLYRLKTYAAHLVFSPTSRYLLTDSSAEWYISSDTNNENHLQLWNMANGQLEKELGNYTFTVNDLAYSVNNEIALYSLHYLTLWRPNLGL